MTQANVNIAIAQQGDDLILGGASALPLTFSYEELRLAIQRTGLGTDFWSFNEDFRGRVSTAVTFPFTLHLTGSGTFATPAAQAAGGIADIVTGASSADANTIAFDLVHLVSKGPAFFEARLFSKTAITNRIIEVGFSDALSETANLAFTSTDSTVVAVADNAAIFQYNTGDTPGDIWVAASVNATTAAATALAAAPVADTFQKLAVAIDADGTARFYINGTLVHTKAAAVATTAVLTPWVTLKTLTGAAATVTVDYLYGYGNSGLTR